MKPRRQPTAAPTSRQAISRQLRAVILARETTAYTLGQQTGMDPGIIQRFLNEERDIRLDTLDRLADVLGLRLVEAARTRGRPARPDRTAAPRRRPRPARADEPRSNPEQPLETPGDDRPASLEVAEPQPIDRAAGWPAAPVAERGPSGLVEDVTREPALNQSARVALGTNSDTADDFAVGAAQPWWESCSSPHAPSGRLE